MKAIVYHRFGSPDVLQLKEMEKPTPGDHEVLIKVRAASVNPIDGGLMRGGLVVRLIVRVLIGARKPTKTRPGRVGRDVAGQVEEVGKKVTRFHPGDPVFGSCRGAFAEYACISESALVIKPDNVTFEQAASAPVAAVTALQGLRDRGRIQPGRKVLINGAAGGVGTFAVQIARSFGTEVTGVCSTRNVEMVRSIGADRVIDYTRKDFTESGQRYDLIFDCVGNRSLSACRRALNPGGMCVVAGAGGVWTFLIHALEAPVLSRFVSPNFVLLVAKITQDDLKVVGELMATGKVTPVIDRRYTLSEVPEAIRYLEGRHARGKVVITPEPGTPT